MVQISKLYSLRSSLLPVFTEDCCCCLAASVASKKGLKSKMLAVTNYMSGERHVT